MSRADPSTPTINELRKNYRTVANKSQNRGNSAFEISYGKAEEGVINDERGKTCCGYEYFCFRKEQDDEGGHQYGHAEKNVITICP